MSRHRHSRRRFRDFFQALPGSAKGGRTVAQRDRFREALKLACGSVGAAVLLVFVFYMAVYSRTAAQTQGSQGTLRDFSPLRVVSLTEGESALWQYTADGESEPDSREGDSQEGDAWPGDHVWSEDNAWPMDHAWRKAPFDASSWKTGRGSFGSAGGTLTEQVKERPVQNLLALKRPEGKTVPVYYFRTEFQVTDAAELKQLRGRLFCDDCAVLYLNDSMIYAVNPPVHGFETEGYGAGRAYGAPLEERFVISDLSALAEGTNVLAVELHQANENSSDIYFELDYLEASNESVEPFGESLEDAGRDLSETGAASGKAQPVGESLDTTGLVLEVGEASDGIYANWLTDRKSAVALMWREKDGRADGPWQSALMGRRPAGTKNQYVYRGMMSGLSAQGEYEYKLKDLASGTESRETAFCTAGEEAFSFVFAGDPQIGAENVGADGAAWEKALAQAVAIDPEIDFVVSAGDQADSSDPEKAMEEFAAFRAPSLLKFLPLAVNMGNHESSENGMDDQFERLYENDLYDYRFVRGDTLFYAINTNNKEYEKHIKGLERAIREQEPRWVIVTMHYSIFGGKERGGDSSVYEAREAYAQAFSDLNVDLVLSGHDHLYARTFYMEGAQSAGKDGGEKDAGEVLYVSGGSATGSKFYERGGEDDPYLAFSQQTGESIITFVSVDASQIRIRACRVSDGEVIDQCAIGKEEGR